MCVLGVGGVVLNCECSQSCPSLRIYLHPGLGIYLATSIMLSIGVSSYTKAYMFDVGVRIDNGNSIAIAVFNGLLSLLTGEYPYLL